MGKPTIIDVANRLGISKTTVADALKGSGRVSEETRLRVQKAARELGYVSNRAARQLRSSSTEAIALYVPPSVRNMSFYMPYALGIADRAADNNYDLTLISQRPAGSSWAHVDGVIIGDAVLEDPVVQSLIRHSVPLVTGGRIAGLPTRRLGGVIAIEYAKMCSAILDGMAELGVARPALVAPRPADEYSWSRQIINGHKDWCRAKGIPVNAATLPSFPSTAELEAALLRVIARPGTDAIIFGWQDIAVRAEAILARQGLQVGEGLQLASLVTSHENLHETYIAGLDLRPYEFGQEAAQLLMEVISSPQRATIYRQHPATITYPRTGTKLNQKKAEASLGV